ncbi:MAG: hypothetical protein Q8J66_06025 [Methylotenera sp.]|nr:hypothetical protein [Methylotenera sp.]
MSYLTPQLFYSSLLSIIFLIPLNLQAAITDITRIYKQTPKLAAFGICTGGGCAEIKQTSLADYEWKTITAIFETSNQSTDTTDAQLERKHIAEAIGALEKMVGAKTATSTDRAGTFNNSEYPGQLDCNDEAINSTTYMRLMHQHGLIKLHQIEDMRTRSFFLFGWPHSAASIREIATGERYAVDSWFYDNGFPATIIPLSLWKSGYFPSDSPIVSKRSAEK